MIIRYTLVFAVLGIAAFGAWRLSLSVSPAAMRNSMTPYCRPFSSCSKTSPQVMAKNKGAGAPLFEKTFFRTYHFILQSW